MFTNTSKKIKLCAYIFFIGSLLNRGVNVFIDWMHLEFSTVVLWSMVERLFFVVVGYFVISLMIYGFGKIVGHFEEENTKSQQL